MQRVDRSVLVPFGAARMFSLVADVPSYPEFLPWCDAATVEPIDESHQRATVSLDFGGVRSRFTTLNTLQPPTVILLERCDGPFAALHGRWSFEALGEHGCRVSLHLTYGFSTGLLGRAIAPVFDRIADSLIDSFVRRAEALDEAWRDAR